MIIRKNLIFLLVYNILLSVLCSYWVIPFSYRKIIKIFNFFNFWTISIRIFAPSKEILFFTKSRLIFWISFISNKLLPRFNKPIIIQIKLRIFYKKLIGRYFCVLTVIINYTFYVYYKRSKI